MPLFHGPTAGSEKRISTDRSCLLDWLRGGEEKGNEKAEEERDKEEKKMKKKVEGKDEERVGREMTPNSVKPRIL